MLLYTLAYRNICYLQFLVICTLMYSCIAAALGQRVRENADMVDKLKANLKVSTYRFILQAYCDEVDTVGILCVSRCHTIFSFIRPRVLCYLHRHVSQACMKA